MWLGCTGRAGWSRCVADRPPAVDCLAQSCSRGVAGRSVPAPSLLVRIGALVSRGVAVSLLGARSAFGSPARCVAVVVMFGITFGFAGTMVELESSTERQLAQARAEAARTGFSEAHVALDTLHRNAEVALWVSLGAAVITVSLVALLLARERALQIGLLRALGSSTGQAVSFVSAEVSTLGLAGGLTGVGVVVVSGPGLASLFDVRAVAGELTLRSASSATVVLGIALGTIAAAVAALFVARLRPMDVLRHVD